MHYNHSANTLTIDLGAISENYNIIRTMMLPNVRSAAMVQADAFGFGAIEVVKKLSPLGCNNFFVANIDEAIAIREYSLTDNTFVLGGLRKGEENYFYLHNITPILNSVDELLLWHKFAKRKNTVMPAVLNCKIDNNNIGLNYNDICILHEQEKFSNLEILYIINQCIKKQDIILQQNISNVFKNLKIIFPKTLTSVVSPIGDFYSKEYHYDLIILGVCLYGITDNTQLQYLRSSISLTSKISILNDNLALVPLGYADGFFRLIDNNGYFYIADTIAPFLDKFSTDFITLNITNIPEKDIYIGANVEIIGDNCSISKLASFFNISAHEMLISLSHGRFHKKYLRRKP